MTIIGIDPGFDRIGWGVIDCHARQCHVLAYGCIQTNHRSDIFTRYQQIMTELTDILIAHQPIVAAIESLFFAKNQKTALRVSEARGVIISHLLKAGCQVVEYTPQAVKIAVTGYGRADKKAVEKMVRSELNLKQNTLIDDTLDALAVAVTHGIST